MCPADPIDAAEVGWHAGDGSVSDGGNMTSLSLEIIMNENPEHDEKAKDNGARIAAWNLWKHKLTIDDLVTHTYWVNKSADVTFDDVDKQCTNPLFGKKWCPYYIFGSTNAATALKNWKAFKALVKKYLDELNGVNTEKEALTQINIKEGDIVSVAADAVYYHGVSVPNFVVERTWIVKSISGDRVVIDKSEDGKYSINSPINVKYLTVTPTLPKDEIKEKDDVTVDIPAEVPGEEDDTVPEMNETLEYIKEPEEAQAFLIKLLNHIIDFIVRLFKK